MRTTLTIDDDIAALLRRLQRTRKMRMRALVNEALREGLARMVAPPAPPAPFRQTTHDLGACRMGNLDGIAELLELADGAGWK